MSHIFWPYLIISNDLYLKKNDNLLCIEVSWNFIGAFSNFSFSHAFKWVAQHRSVERVPLHMLHLNGYKLLGRQVYKMSVEIVYRRILCRHIEKHCFFSVNNVPTPPLTVCVGIFFYVLLFIHAFLGGTFYSLVR